MDNSVEYERYLGQLENSGKCIFGGNSHDYLSALLNELITEGEHFSLVLIESNEACTFSSKEKVIYLTTGLVAQVIHQDQLAYFIAREIERVNTGLFPNPDKKDKISVSYEEKIVSLSKSSLETDQQLDAKALKRYETSGFNLNYVLGCFKVLKYSHLPFEEIKVPSSYLQTDQYYIPESRFEVPTKLSELPSFDRITKKFETIEKRVQHLTSIISLSHPANSLNDDLDDGFSQLKRAAHLQYVRQTLIDEDFDLSIYSIFLVENLYNIEKEEVAWLKALAWYGYSMKNIAKFERKQSVYHQNTGTTSSNFFYVLRQFNSAEISSLAMRQVYDLRSVDSRVETLWQQLLFDLKNYHYFDLKTFSKKSYDEVWGNQTVLDAGGQDKYAKLDSIQKRDDLSIGDTAELYLYGLSDILSSEQFWNDYDSLNEAPLDVIGNISVIPSVIVNKKREFDSDRTKKKTESLNQSFAKYTDLDISGYFHEFPYEFQAGVKELFAQQFGARNYEEVIPLIDVGFIAELNLATEYVAFPFFQTAFRPQVRGFHMLGLLGVMLPAVVTDFVLKSNQSDYAIIVVRVKTGEIIHVGYESFHEPINGPSMYNRIYQSLNSITSLNQ